MKKILLLSVILFSFKLFAEEDLFSSLDVAKPVVDAPPTSEDELKDAALIAGDPDFQIRDYYRRRRPEYQVKVPEIEDGEGMMWKLGDVFRDLDIPIGEYTIIRVHPRGDGFHIRYIGNVYSDGKHATITQATNEIVPGDYIVKESFKALSLPSITSDGGSIPKALEAIGTVAPFLEPDQDENYFYSGTKQLLGAKFDDYKGGNSTTIGACFTIRRKGVEVAKAIVVDTDLDLATLYIYQSIREVKANDEIFTK